MTGMRLFYSLCCSVTPKPFPAFGLSLRSLVLSVGESHWVVLTPFFPSEEVLYSTGAIVVHALGLRDEGKISLSFILVLPFTNKLGDLGQVFEPLGAFCLLMCTTEIIVSAFPSLQDYSKDQII